MVMSVLAYHKNYPDVILIMKIICREVGQKLEKIKKPLTFLEIRRNMASYSSIGAEQKSSPHVDTTYMLNNRRLLRVRHPQSSFQAINGTTASMGTATSRFPYPLSAPSSLAEPQPKLNPEQKQRKKREQPTTSTHR